MPDDERLRLVKELLFDYVKSPSLRHIRDPHALIKLAQEIVRRIDLGNSMWKKWDSLREHVVKSALCCWVPIEDLHVFLNGMPGPRLTLVDVAQRLRAFEDEEHFSYPNEDLRAGCLALYEKEKAEGTELPAVIGLLRDHVEREEERIRAEQQARYEQWRTEDRMAREQRLRSGADCGWTQLPKSKHWYCRTNGRTYRLSPTPDKMWSLHRVGTVSEDDKGTVIGKYRQRGDATKVVRETAYQAEPRW